MKLNVMTAVVMLASTPCITAAFAQTASSSQARLSDDELSSLIATRIANDKSLSADAVKVTVKNGVVTLSGVVGKNADKTTADAQAPVPGVEPVDNKLT
jgi:osmotically-inducible protein OsmY